VSGVVNVATGEAGDDGSLKVPVSTVSGFFEREDRPFRLGVEGGVSILGGGDFSRG
jgi:hypothetical protein